MKCLVHGDAAVSLTKMFSDPIHFTIESGPPNGASLCYHICITFIEFFNHPISCSIHFRKSSAPLGRSHAAIHPAPRKGLVTCDSLILFSHCPTITSHLI